MADFKQTEKVQMSRRQAAERLVDLAYLLTAGRPLEVTVEGETVSVVVPEQLTFERESKSEGDSVELGVEISWSSGVPCP